MVWTLRWVSTWASTAFRRFVDGPMVGSNVLGESRTRGDSHVAHPVEASERGPEVGCGYGVFRDVWRRSAASVGRQPARGPAGRWQGGARLCGGFRRGAVATRWQSRSGGGRAGGRGQGQARGVPASRSLGAGTGVLGGVDGGPPADADDLAGAIGGALGASLAGSDSGAETFLGDVAAGLETLWDSPGIGCGRGSGQALGPLGWGVPGAGEDRAPADRCGCKRRGSPWGVATAPDPELRPAGLGGTARSQASGTAVAQLGRGTCGAPSPREGGGRANGVCLVGEHGQPAEVSCGWCV